MTNFDIRITEDNGDVALYPETNSISINDGTIELDCGENGGHTHQLDRTNEITIVTNR
jgi:hypothetical protein